MKLLISFILLSAFISCTKKDLIRGPGQEFSLCYNDEGNLVENNERQIMIKFSGLIEDSRCPDGAQCIWSGRAVVELKLNSSESIMLGIGDLQTGTTSPVAGFYEYDDYKITLLEVQYDKKRHKGKEKRYRIRLRVDRK